MKIQFNDLNRIHAPLSEEFDEAWRRVVSTNSFILGKEVEKFEDSFAKYHGLSGSQNCATVSSGTDALELILRAKGIGLGDEVITVSNTFYATGSSIVAVGARPVFVDINPRTALIDVNQVEQKINSKTVAILPVHLYGQQADMASLRAIADRKGLTLIEDACQAHGTRQKGMPPGTLGDAVAYSFYPGKNLGAFGDAGAVVSKDQELIARIKKMRNYGQTNKYHHDEIGFNKRMDGLQAAILSVKLPHLDSWNDSRVSSAVKLIGFLGEDKVRVLKKSDGNSHNYHLFVIESENRDGLIKHLEEKGVQTGIHYPVPIHMQPAFSYLGVKRGELPITERLSDRIVSLPIFPKMREDEIEYIANTVNSFSP